MDNHHGRKRRMEGICQLLGIKSKVSTVRKKTILFILYLYKYLEDQRIIVLQLSLKQKCL